MCELVSERTKGPGPCNFFDLGLLRRSKGLIAWEARLQGRSDSDLKMKATYHFRARSIFIT